MTHEQFLSRRNLVRETQLSSQPVFVLFEAEWSGSCHIVGRMVDKVAAKFAGQLKVVRINTDLDKQLTEYYRVANIPTLLFFVKGEVVDRIEGLFPEADLCARILSVLK